MSSNFYGKLSKFCRTIIQLFYKKYSVNQTQIPEGPVVYISHHQNLFGPFITLLSFPKNLHCWILHVFLDKEACYRQYSEYTFSQRFGFPKWMANTAAFFVSSFVPALLKSGKGIPVYRGSREILQTFEKSIDVLKKNESIVIFPDVDYSDTSSEVGDLYEGFLFLEKYYYQATGKHIAFVPLYGNREKKNISIGKPIYFTEDEPFKKERKNVLEKIQKSLNELREQE